MNDLRLNLAWEQLQNAESVKEVSIELRYKQASHFSRVFKNRFGITPAARLKQVVSKEASARVSFARYATRDLDRVENLVSDRSCNRVSSFAPWHERLAMNRS
jgi:AraC-like DNA-binding protein